MYLPLAIDVAQQHCQVILSERSNYAPPSHHQAQLPTAPDYLHTSSITPIDLDAISSRGPG